MIMMQQKPTHGGLGFYCITKVTGSSPLHEYSKVGAIIKQRRDFSVSQKQIHKSCQKQIIHIPVLLYLAVCLESHEQVKTRSLLTSPCMFAGL